MTFDLDLWAKVVTFDLDFWARVMTLSSTLGIKVMTFDLGVPGHDLDLGGSRS